MTDRELLEFMKNVSEDVRRLNQTLLEQGIQLPLPVQVPQESPLEEKFARVYSAMFPNTFLELEHEYKFHPSRKWRFDFAHVATKVAIELEGGIYGKSRHTQAQGYIDDCDKYNAAAAHDWVVFRLATGMVTGDRLADIQETIKGRPHARRTPADSHGSIADGTRPQADGT
jgi:very-short-patch-repair endonuclease